MMKTILIFEPLSGGHRARFIRWLAESLSREPRTDVQFVFAVSPGMDVPASGAVTVRRIPAETAHRLESAGRWTKPWRLNRLFRQLCAETRPAHALILELTHLELPLALTGSPCPLSAILFVQYPELKRGLKFYLKEWKTALLLRRAAVKTLFLLNGEEACRYLTDRFGARTRFVPLPDPVPEIKPDPEFVMRDVYGIAPDRTVFLFFGAISKRKGAHLLLNALRLLNADSAAHSAFLFCGQPEPDYRREFEKGCARLKTERADLQVIMDSRFVPDEEMAALFEQSDMVLLPYTRPDYSSGILALAARARTPVIGPDTGLLGRLIRQYGLGAVCPITPDALADAIALCAETPVAVDPEKQRAFVEKSRPEEFTRLLFETIAHES
jgi:glycosyltransferase involved in cell wall biosynthesis